MNALKLTMAAVVWLLATSGAQAQATHGAQDAPARAASATRADPRAAAAEAGHDVNHPVLPDRAPWAGVVVIVILVGLFLPAAVIGPIVRALAPEEEPETHSHDEPPGASGHHGHSGTLAPHETAHGHGGHHH